MTTIVFLFLFVAIYFYIIFGGADFGVGILELLSSRENRKVTKKIAYQIIGPVWEANHVWLIIVVVIMWITFPNYYYIVTTQLHIPLTLLLFGIVVRGTAFIFRHYDAVTDGSQKIYNKLFQYSSIITPFLLGVSAGALVSGKLIPLDDIENHSFATVYIHSWFNITSLLMGIFVTSLVAFLSAVFLVGETSGNEQKLFIKKAKKANISVAISSMLIFGYGFYAGEVFIDHFFDNLFSIVLVVLASSLLIPIWIYLGKGKKVTVRIIVAAQVFLILGAWVQSNFPDLIFTSEGPVSIYENMAGEAVINSIAFALLAGAVLILPGLFHLFKAFGLFKALQPSENKD
ncbi:cytochrome d ubiquinol oxidase subunit II [Sinomicrobium weinanense]|uniref:Cytochrome d ubiquinol oxidase subunit II n=1 Tax=Sinomicrobium weinanense TaxID=2842200 RepID=A0A926JTT4_9FLAO|nr:cytochrome d ubiquinol oxidase subunit II [Sinomicrobium weinanense]MBC9797061.1 cytochrome d ubiquinol oxidase subunit II [Sinomicrobium weinanense]MBU3122056.1 cytochrome d ubiquinol oxidase subunit II [Sinomicrobium weinanense]